MSNPFAHLVGESTPTPADWPASRTRQHCILDDEPTDHARAAAIRKHVNEVREKRRELPPAPSKKVAPPQNAPEELPAVLPVPVRAARTSALPELEIPRFLRPAPAAKRAPAPPPAPAAMTYADAVKLRERSRMRQPVDQALLLEANRIVAETRAKHRQLSAGDQ